MNQNSIPYGRALLDLIGYREGVDGATGAHAIPKERLNGLKRHGIEEDVIIGTYVDGTSKETVVFLPTAYSDVKFVARGKSLDRAVNALLPQFEKHPEVVRLYLGHYGIPTFPPTK